MGVSHCGVSYSHKIYPAALQISVSVLPVTQERRNCIHALERKLVITIINQCATHKFANLITSLCKFERAPDAIIICKVPLYRIIGYSLDTSCVEKTKECSIKEDVPLLRSQKLDYSSLIDPLVCLSS